MTRECISPADPEIKNLIHHGKFITETQFKKPVLFSSNALELTFYIGQSNIYIYIYIYIYPDRDTINAGRNTTI